MADKARFTITSLLKGKSAVAQSTPVSTEGDPAAIGAPGLSGSIGLGLEIANIAALPDAVDYAQDEFYCANFTPSEIAHSIKEPVAKAAFQSLLAAKRAIVKSGAVSEPQEGYKNIEISFDGEGRPCYPGCLLSLSDTGTMAAAACFWPAAQPATAAEIARAEQRIIPTRIRIVALLVVLSLLVLFGIGFWKILDFLLPHR
jgi:phosphopantetheinyl transferase (holo-ACP synthase)